MEPTIGEVLAALSHALDLTEGQLRGHSVRSWMIARRIGQAIGLTGGQLESLFYACLLKDSGCSSNAARVYSIFGGDDLLAKQKVKFIDWTNPFESVKYTFTTIEPGGSIRTKLRKMAAMMGPYQQSMDEVTNARCTRGSMIALQLGFGEDVASAIQCLDEHWDGRGSPSHLARTDIPILGRVLCLAQTLEVFVTTFGIVAAYDVAHKRNTRWFDPDVVHAATSFRDDHAFWAEHAAHVAGASVGIYEPRGTLGSVTDIDKVCEAFAMIVDAKSSFTAEHSSRVATYALHLGDLFGFPIQQKRTLIRAGLLHDIGKLGVPNSILDKLDKLDPKEYKCVQNHPRYSYEILSQIRGFGEITKIASAHHERLDGKGYWRGLSADDLDINVRIITASDVFDALTAARPYREALSVSHALHIMQKEAGTSVDEDCVAGLKALYGERELMAA